MAATAQSAIAVIGIDIGKNSFHVVGLYGRGAFPPHVRVIEGLASDWHRLDERIEGLSSGTAGPYIRVRPGNTHDE